MTISLTPEQAKVFLGFIDATLKAKGIEALDAAWLFKSKIQEAAQQEQNEIKHPNFQSAMATTDTASQG